ncbi:MAG: hypothetical protein M1608_05655 [Candidatus Omnitrophica bacterium]|nr:hypothetical protein [Candidatus Omnitrophota bacterium]
MIRLLLILLTLGVAQVVASTNSPAPPAVQGSTPADANASRTNNNPVIILSDGGIEMDALKGVVIYRKNVRVLDAQIELACEQLTASHMALENGTLGDVTAETNVVIAFKDRDNVKIIRGDKAVYTVTNDTVIVSGNPELRVYNFTNNVANLTNHVTTNADAPKPLIERLLANANETNVFNLETNVFKEPPSVETTTDGSFVLERQKGQFRVTGKPKTVYYGQPLRPVATNVTNSAETSKGRGLAETTGPQSLHTTAVPPILLNTNLPRTLQPPTGLEHPGSSTGALTVTPGANTNAPISIPWSTNQPLMIHPAPIRANTNLTGSLTGRVDKATTNAAGTNAAPANPAKKWKFTMPERGMVPFRNW